MTVAAFAPSLSPPSPTGPSVSVVIACFNRRASIEQLLKQLDAQSLATPLFEVIVVDDGSAEPLDKVLVDARYAFSLMVLRQDNQGPAAARHAGILAARGALIVILDDDMRIASGFLEAHCTAHREALANAGVAHGDEAADRSIVVLGRLRQPADAALTLVERYQLAQLDRLAREVAADPTRLRGGHLYTGNVSFARALYLQVGGFDSGLRLSEDAELGIRFERAGAQLCLADAAWSEHASDHNDLEKWIARSIAYGETDSRIAAKHAGVAEASPWRFLFRVHPVSRVLLVLAVVAPRVGVMLARTVLAVARAVAAVGAERAAMAGTTLAYGLWYYTGVRAAAGSARASFAGMRAYLVSEQPSELGAIGLLAKCVADIGADHAMLCETDGRYRPNTRARGVVGDAVQRIGFQLLVAYRIMRLCRQLRFGLLARICSRLMRHLYSADVHWDAELAPGVVIVHGIGLVISHAARVGTGCVLFQQVTLGESIHPVTREVGAPTLEPHVHVAPGAVLIGPIVIGQQSKIAANAVVSASVPARSVVESPAMIVRSRDGVTGHAAAEPSMHDERVV